MTSILLVAEPPDMRALLRHVLEDLGGYTVADAHVVPAALSVLRASPQAMVALFGTTAGTGLLRAAVADPALRRHAFVLLTAYPEGVTPEWRALLKSLDVPVITKPFALESLLTVVADAAVRAVERGGRPLQV